MIMCCMSYLSAVTLQRQRTTRVSLLESMSFLGGFLGPFVGSALFEGAGRTWSFTALVIVNAAIVVYVVLLVPEVPPPRPPPAGGTVCQKLARVSGVSGIHESMDCKNIQIKKRSMGSVEKGVHEDCSMQRGAVEKRELDTA